MKLIEMVDMAECDAVMVWAFAKGERRAKPLLGELGDLEFMEKIREIGDWSVSAISVGYERGFGQYLEITACEG